MLLILGYPIGHRQMATNMVTDNPPLAEQGGRMELGDWHPRHIPESLLRCSALQEQQSHTLPAWEQWYLMLLHNGALPVAPSKRRNSAFTGALLESAQNSVARLRWEATEVALRNFLLDQSRLGIVCTKYRTSVANGWSFPSLAECRAASERPRKVGQRGRRLGMLMEGRGMEWRVCGGLYLMSLVELSQRSTPPSLPYPPYSPLFQRRKYPFFPRGKKNV